MCKFVFFKIEVNQNTLGGYNFEEKSNTLTLYPNNLTILGCQDFLNILLPG